MPIFAGGDELVDRRQVEPWNRRCGMASSNMPHSLGATALPADST